MFTPYQDKNSGLTFIHDGTNYRALGALPPIEKVSASFPLFTSRFPVLERKYWQETNRSKVFSLPIRDQGQYGSCASQAAWAGFSSRWVMSGQLNQYFSGTYLYAWCNGGKDNGSAISQILDAMRNNGMALESDFPEGRIFLKQMNQATVDKARKRFNIVDAYRISSFNEICSALTLGLDVIFGILVGQNFTNLDQYGVAPPPDIVLGGHGLCGRDLKFHPVTREPLIWTQNSWAKSFGINGFCNLTQENFQEPIDAFCLASVADDPEDNSNDPPVAQ